MVLKRLLKPREGTAWNTQDFEGGLAAAVGGTTCPDSSGRLLTVD